MRIVPNLTSDLQTWVRFPHRSQLLRRKWKYVEHQFRYRKCKHWSLVQERSLIDWLAIRYRRMDGQSVIGIESWPDSLTDRPTDRIRNKPAGKPTTDHPSDQLIDNSKQTNQPSDRLAINPTTNNPSISD